MSQRLGERFDVGTAALVAGHRLVFGGGGPWYTPQAIEADDGAPVWTGFGGSNATSTPALGVDGALIVPNADGNVYAYDPASGAIRWKYPTGHESPGPATVGADGTTYFTTPTSLYAVEGASGRLNFQLPAPTGTAFGRIQPVIGVGGSLLLLTAQGILVAIGP